MKRLVLGLLIAFGCLPTLSFAYSPIFNEVTQVYGVLPLEQPITTRYEYHGILHGYPDTYSFMVDATTTLSVAIDAYAGDKETEQFNGIIVRKNPLGGVTEVARLSSLGLDWSKGKDDITRLWFGAGPTYSGEVGPGSYRVEVSNPLNEGRYRVTFGEEESATGYWEEVRAIKETRDFYGKWSLSMVVVPHVYLPLGIVALLGAIWITWRRRHRL